MTTYTPVQARELAGRPAYSRYETIRAALLSLANQVEALEAQLAASATLERAYKLGFLRCAGWAQRDDLFSDVTSPAYRKDRAHDLATITTQPQATGVALSHPKSIDALAQRIRSIDGWHQLGAAALAEALCAAHGIKPAGEKGGA